LSNNEKGFGGKKISSTEFHRGDTFRNYDKDSFFLKKRLELRKGACSILLPLQSFPRILILKAQEFTKKLLAMTTDNTILLQLLFIVNVGNLCLYNL